MTKDRLEAKDESSTLHLRFGDCQIRLSVYLPGSMRLRRQILLGCYRGMREVLPVIRSAYIKHSDEHPMNRSRSVLRDVSFRQIAEVGSLEARRGSEIRMARLKLGLTQRELAERAHLHPVQLSEIERGRVKAKPRTWERLREALSSSEP